MGAITAVHGHVQDLHGDLLADRRRRRERRRLRPMPQCCPTRSSCAPRRAFGAPLPCRATSRSRTGRSCSRSSRAGRAGSRGAGDGEDVRSTRGDRRGPRRHRRARPRARPAGGLPGRVARVATRSPSPRRALDCGNSGTTARLVAGLLAGRRCRPSSTGTPRCAAARWAGSRSRCGRWGRALDGPAAAPCSRSTRRSRAAAPHRPRHAGAERPGEVGDPARGPGGGRDHDRHRGRGDPRPHRADAPGPRRHRARVHDTGRRPRRRAGRPERVPAIDETVPADPSGAAFWLVAASSMPTPSSASRG